MSDAGEAAREALLELSREVLELDLFYELRTRSYPALGGTSSVLEQLAIKARKASGFVCEHPLDKRVRFATAPDLEYQCIDCRYICYTAEYAAEMGIAQADETGSDGGASITRVG
jgi:hypothetical protein